MKVFITFSQDPNYPIAMKFIASVVKGELLFESLSSARALAAKLDLSCTCDWRINDLPIVQNGSSADSGMSLGDILREALNNNPDPRMTEIKNFWFNGRKIDAIKQYRTLTDAGLKEAKDHLEFLTHHGISNWYFAHPIKC